MQPSDQPTGLPSSFPTSIVSTSVLPPSRHRKTSACPPPTSVLVPACSSFHT
jgi:hypothetical protein